MIVQGKGMICTDACCYIECENTEVNYNINYDDDDEENITLLWIFMLLFIICYYLETGI